MRRIIAAFFFLAIANTVHALPPPQPKIACVTPDSGSIAGGDTVLITIDHVDLTSKNDVLVLFDRTSAVHATIVDSRTVSVITPKHRRGTVDVAVRIYYSSPFFTYDVLGGAQSYSFTSDEPIHFADYEPILLPVVVWEGAGASVVGGDGARWTTNVTISNSGDHDVEVVFGQPPRIRNVRAGEWATLWRTGDDRAAGAIVYVERRGAANVALSLHVVSLYAYIDTEVPPVREHELRGGAIDLPGVRYYGARGTLRVYDVNATPDAAVNVAAYDYLNTFLASVRLPLTSPASGYASYGSLDLREALNLVPGGAYRLVVEPLSAYPMRLWAFVASPDDGGGHIRTTTPH